MNNRNKKYEILSKKDFDLSVERFYKKKKFKKLPNQIEKLVKEFESGEFSGSLLKRKPEPTPYEVYKKRLPNEDTKVGKSNGYRIVYLVASENKVVGLLDIYYKKETPSLPETYINSLVDDFLNGLLQSNKETEEYKEVQQ